MCDDNHPCAIAYGCFSTTNQNTHHQMHHIRGTTHILPTKAIVLLCSVGWKQTPSNKQMREFSTTINNHGEFSIANAIVLYYTNSLELCELLYMAKQLLLSFLKVPKKNMKKWGQTHSHVGDDMSPKRTVVIKSGEIMGMIIRGGFFVLCDEHGKEECPKYDKCGRDCRNCTQGDALIEVEKNKELTLALIKRNQELIKKHNLWDVKL